MLATGHRLMLIFPTTLGDGNSFPFSEDDAGVQRGDLYTQGHRSFLCRASDEMTSRGDSGVGSVSRGKPGEEGTVLPGTFRTWAEPVDILARDARGTYLGACFSSSASLLRCCVVLTAADRSRWACSRGNSP